MIDDIDRNEHIDPQITFEVRSERDITEKDLSQLSAFAKEELEIFKAIENRSVTSIREQGEALWNHLKANKMAYTAGKDQKVPFRFIFARDTGGNLIGYSMCSLYSLGDNPDFKDTELSFLGVKSKYQRQGIGTRILRETNKVLMNLGITKYITNAHPKVVRIFNNLGMRYVAEPLPGKDPDRKHLTVFLK